jgi:hypothetical protein
MRGNDGPAAVLQNPSAGRVELWPLSVADAGRRVPGSGGRVINCSPVMPPSVIAGGTVRRSQSGDQFLVLGAAGEVWVVHEPALGQERKTLAPLVARWARRRVFGVRCGLRCASPPYPSLLPFVDVMLWAVWLLPT